MYEFVQIPIILFLMILLLGIVSFAFNIYIMYKWGRDMDELDRLEKAYRKDCYREVPVSLRESHF